MNRPIKELKGFDKVFAEAGQMKKATISIPKKYATSFWDEHRNAWVQEMGRYTIHCFGRGFQRRHSTFSWL
jgi:beta-glucosidase